MLVLATCARVKVLARTSKHGRLALLLESTLPNDGICTLYGCSAPVVLRKTPDKTTGREIIWELIGECYMYEMMVGEALIERQIGNKKETKKEREFYDKIIFKFR
jgi:hypothetical protein